MPTVSPFDCRSPAADSAADLLVVDLSTIVQAERPAGQSGKLLVGDADGVPVGLLPGAIAPPAGGVGATVGLAPGGGGPPPRARAPVVGLALGEGVTVTAPAGVGVGAWVTRAGPLDSSAIARM